MTNVRAHVHVLKQATRNASQYHPATIIMCSHICLAVDIE